MEIDRGVETVSGLSPGSFTSLNVDIGVLFVGGTPLFLPPTNLIRFRNTGEEVTHILPISTLPLSHTHTLCLLSLSLSLSLSLTHTHTHCLLSLSLSHTHTHTHTHTLSLVSLSHTQ